MKNFVLITGAIMTSDNTSLETYHQLVSYLEKNYEVSSPLDTIKFCGNEAEKYQRAITLVEKSDLLIAEMSHVSTGQGMELQHAVNLGIPILVIAKYGSSISSLVKGCSGVEEFIYYENISDVKDKILEFVSKKINLCKKQENQKLQRKF